MSHAAWAWWLVTLLVLRRNVTSCAVGDACDEYAGGRLESEMGPGFNGCEAGTFVIRRCDDAAQFFFPRPGDFRRADRRGRNLRRWGCA